MNKWTLGRPWREAHGIVEPPRQKRRKTGGRKAGTPNKKTRRRAQLRGEIIASCYGKQAAPRAAVKRPSKVDGNQKVEAAQRPEMEPWDERRHAHVVRDYYEGSRQHMATLESRTADSRP